jgi:hypothetical protein
VLEVSIELAADPVVLQTARWFVDETLAAWGLLESLHDDARLITSELSANAVLHARTDFRVTLRSTSVNHLRIEVRDWTAHMSFPAAPRLAATSGRGLVLVDFLATSWGTQMASDGKVVWVELHASRTGPRHAATSRTSGARRAGP